MCRNCTQFSITVSFFNSCVLSFIVLYYREWFLFTQILLNITLLYHFLMSLTQGVKNLLFFEWFVTYVLPDRPSFNLKNFVLVAYYVEAHNISETLTTPAKSQRYVYRVIVRDHATIAAKKWLIRLGVNKMKSADWKS